MSSTQLPVKTIFKSPRELNTSCPSGTSMMQRNLFRALINEAQKQAASVTTEKYIFKIPIAEVKAILGIEWAKNIEIAHQLKNLMTLDYIYSFLDKDVAKHVIGSPISAVRVTDGSPYIEFTFNTFLQPIILKPEIYTNINLLTITKIKVDRADVLYTYLVDYLTAYKIPYLTIDEFRRLLGLHDEAYPVFANFKMRVLDPITKEINEETDIDCSYELIKGYRNAWAGIQWTAKAKPGCHPRKPAIYKKAKIEIPDASKTEIPEIENHPKTDEEYYRYFISKGYTHQEAVDEIHTNKIVDAAF